MSNSRLRILYEDDPTVLALIEWAEREEERAKAREEEFARLEDDYKRRRRTGPCSTPRPTP